jgi:hypothetical protein
MIRPERHGHFAARRVVHRKQRLPTRCYAVNLLEAEESRIEPRKEIQFSSVTVAAEEQTVQRANVPLWPWLVLAALVLVCLEWLAYNLKARI